MSELDRFDQTSDESSPFDRIRHADRDGEYWNGRELQALMGYSKWQDFASVVERACASLAIVQGAEAAEANFALVTQVTRAGNLGDQVKRDYRLTRFAAYLVAMAADDTKPRVAEARVYFAVRTREAETASQRVALPTPRELARMVIEAEDRAEAARLELEAANQNIRVLAPKAEYVDHHVKPGEGTMLRRDLAKQCEVQEGVLNSYLINKRFMYSTVEGYRSNGQPDLAWHPYAGDAVAWFHKAFHHDKPPHASGKTRHTLRVTPVGAVQIRRRLVRDGLVAESPESGGDALP